MINNLKLLLDNNNFDELNKLIWHPTNRREIENLLYQSFVVGKTDRELWLKIEQKIQEYKNHLYASHLREINKITISGQPAACMAPPASQLHYS